MTLAFQQISWQKRFYHTYQLSFLHALQDHEQNLCSLGLTVVKSLLDCNQQLFFGIIIYQSEIQLECKMNVSSKGVGY